MSALSRVIIKANLNKRNAVEVATRIRERLLSSGCKVDLVAELAEAVGEPPSSVGMEGADLVLSLGGDGTMLDTVRQLDGAETPVLGINLGGLGFLTAVSVDDLESSLDAMIDGQLTVHDQRLLQVDAHDEDGGAFQILALNDIVIDEASFTRRAAVLRLTVDGSSLGSFTADGLIVSTPTGSTAYSLSAGGPVVRTDLPVLVLTPICAHTLAIRPLVFGEEEEVTVENVLPGVSLRVTADGQDTHKVSGDEPIRIHLSPRRARLATLKQRSYYEVLRSKLNWGGTPKDR